ncbi:MAG: hypothetical protein IAF38_03525 [Bacteroidia bacterium]|nr:hypothetical protein [Bacteroidia bacterium]
MKSKRISRSLRQSIVICYIYMCAICVPAIFKSQTFNYTLSIDSSVSYEALSNATPLANDTLNWNFFYKLPVGFSFPFLGKNFDSLRIETNGLIVFEDNNNFSLIAFHNFKNKVDSLGHRSSLSYNVSGNPGEKIFKLQYKNVGQGNDTRELLSYQLWLRENGNTEIVVGFNTYGILSNDSITDTSQVIMMGFINRNMDTGQNGLFISNTPSHPQSTPIDAEHTDLPYLRTMPRSGFRYVFSPVSN